LAIACSIEDSDEPSIRVEPLTLAVLILELPRRGRIRRRCESHRWFTIGTPGTARACSPEMAALPVGLMNCDCCSEQSLIVKLHRPGV